MPVPGLALELKWLDFDGFFPPGARRIGPSSQVSFELATERRTRFPSTDLCSSPNGAAVLFHDGMKRQRDIYHWLLLLKNDAPFPNAIFCTKMAFDATWSEDSMRFAVTHFIGDNSSEVFVVDLSDLERRPIEVRTMLDGNFPGQMISAPMFAKAYRWTRDGRLVVRGIARSEHEPYEQFGCEVLVAFSAPGGEPRGTFLRGYVLPQSEREPRQ